jgi:magnesium and cobalt transporter
MISWLKRLLRLPGKENPDSKVFIQEQEEMKQGIEDLPQTVVKEIMVPRTDVAFISQDDDAEELLKVFKQSGHSRYPVYSETIDNVVGIVYIKDLLRYFGQEISTIRARDLVRKPYFVPESMRLDSLLREMKKRHVHIAVVVDEYGGVSGIVCMEDILEEIIGDIQDEFDNERDEIIPLGGNVYLCDSRTSIDDFNEKLSLSLPNDKFDTLGGFVFDLFGRIPSRFEKIHHNGLDFIVQEVEGYKVRSIKVVVHEEGLSNE